MNNLQKISRILPHVLADGEITVSVPLQWTLPKRSGELSDPEVTIVEAAAIAMSGEICVQLVIRQDSFFVDSESGLVDKAATQHRITKIFEVPGISPVNDVEITAEAALDGACRVLPVVERGMAVTQLFGNCKIKVAYTVFERQQVAFFQPAGLNSDILSETIELASFCGQTNHVLDLSLPAEFAKPPVRLGEITARFVNGKATALPGWLKVEGDVAVNARYLGENNNLLEEIFVFPVRRYLEVAEAAWGMFAECHARVELFTFLRKAGDNGGRFRGLLYLDVRLFRREALEVVTGARGQSHSFPPRTFLLDEFIGTGSSQTLIQREIFFSRPARKVKEPVDAQVRNLTHEIIPNKVIVRGVLHKQLFLVEADTGVVFAQDVDESFVHFVDVPGASPGMRAHVAARVEFVKVDIYPGGESARQVTIIEIAVKVTRLVKKQIIIQPAPPTPVPVLPSTLPAGTVYIVRPGDSIWKIANTFGVSMQAIITANNLSNPNLIFPGQQLVIPR